MADDAKQLQEDLKELERLASKLGKSINFSNLKNDADAVKELLKAWRKETEEINREFSDLSSTFKNVLDDLRNFDSTSSRVNRSFKILGGFADKLKYDAEDISKLSKKDLENLQKKAGIEIENLKTRKTELDLSVKRRFQNLSDEQIASIGARTKNKNLSKEIAQYIELQSIFNENNEFKEEENNYGAKIIKLIDRRLQKEKDITKNLGIMGAAFKGISNTLQKMGVDSDIIKEMGDNLDKAAAKGKVGFKDLFNITTAGFKKAMEDPMFNFVLGLKAFQSGLSDIKKAFNIFLEFDKVFTETARGLGMSIDQVIKMTKATQLSGDAFSKNVYTAAQIGKSISDVNAQLGTSVIVSGQTLDEFTAMTNQMGLSADEASKIYKLSLLNGSSLKDTNKDIAAGILAVQKRSGIQINEKQVFQEIGKLSAGITAKFQQNVPALAAAVAQAKALGTNLEQVDKIGESLLNFESSIENELKAELITGKQLNLEKARYAALTGDQVTLTQELANQVGSLSEFQGMNVIAQKSLAEAFGMSREELAEMLKQQAVFNKLGDVSNMTAQQKLDRAKELKLSNDDALVQDLQRQASAEQLAATFDSIKVSIAAALDGPFKGLVDVFANLAKNAGLIKLAIGGLAAISLIKTIGGLAVMAVQLGMGAAAAITTASAITLGLGIGAVLLGMSALSGAQEDVEASIKARVPGAAFGGVVEAKPGGTLVNVAEAGSDEVLIPLNSPRANTMLGGGGVTVDDLREITANIVNGIRNQSQPDIIMTVEGDVFGRIAGKQASTSTNTRQYNSYNLA
jgi:hypothetical protein